MTLNGLSVGIHGLRTRPPLQLQCPPHPQDAQYGHRRSGATSPEHRPYAEGDVPPEASGAPHHRGQVARRKRKGCLRQKAKPESPFAHGLCSCIG